MTGADSADEVYRRARGLVRIERWAEAEDAVRRGLAVSPGHGPLLTLLASVLRMRRDYAAALRAAEAAIAAAPHLPDAHAERAECLILLVRAVEAVASAEQAVRLDPEDPSGHLVLARALAAARDFDRARVSARRGLGLAGPRSVEGLLTLADVERDAGRRPEALAAVRAAMALDPDNAYGRWLLAMLDAERLHVRRSMRALREVARDNPARPDVISMTWPIRGVLSGLRRGLAVGAAAVCALALVSIWWAPALPAARVLSAVVAAVMIGFTARVLIPAGSLPWRCLNLLPTMMRRATIAALATVTVAVVLLITHAATAHWTPAVLALLLAPVLWALNLIELLGAGLDDPGFRIALTGIARELRDWWKTTRRELREAWSDPNPR